MIPEEIRKRLGLEPGTQFVVIGDGDTVVLKALHAPKLEDLDDLLAEARRAARSAGLKRSDIFKAIERVRAKA